MASGPICAMVWEGRDAVKTGRVLLGATNPLASAPGTIRGDFAIVSSFCLILSSGCCSQLQQPLSSIGFQNSITNNPFSSQDVGRNVCHGSDAVESAQKEIALWFKPEELQSWKQASHDWVYEK